MKTKNRFVSLAALLAVVTVGTAFLTAASPAAAADQAASKKEDRLISLVLLLKSPRKLSEHTLANSISDALGIAHSHDESAATAIVAKPPYYLVKLDTGRFVINTIDGPYFKDTDKLAQEIPDPKLRDAVHEHSAWLSIDWAEKSEPKDVKLIYQQIGKMAAALAGPDTLAVYSPEADQLGVYGTEIAASLRSDDPLSGFAVPAPAAGPESESSEAQTVAISDDDPKLKAAQDEAHKTWSGFVRAFRSKAGKNFAVKGKLVEGDNAEYMWLNVTEIDGERVHGTLANDASDLKGFKIGQDLHIKTSDVDDWLYVDNKGEEHGGFTIKVLKTASTKPQKD